jgi:hypothetical protein
MSRQWTVGDLALAVEWSEIFWQKPKKEDGFFSDMPVDELECLIGVIQDNIGKRYMHQLVIDGTVYFDHTDRPFEVMEQLGDYLVDFILRNNIQVDDEFFVMSENGLPTGISDEYRHCHNAIRENFLKYTHHKYEIHTELMNF